MPASIRQLIEAIEKITNEGISLDDKTLFYIASTFGAATPEFLERLMARSDDAGLDTLFELIFFPDEAFQVRLEPVLASERFSPADIDPVVDGLAQKKWAPMIRFPAGGGACRSIVSRATIRQFVSRLNIGRMIDPAVSRSITDRFNDDAAIWRCRVMLRNGRFCFEPVIVDFLCRLFSRLPTTDPDFFSLLKSAIDFLDHRRSETDIYTALMDRKRHCCRMLHQAERCEEEMRKEPVEALIMRGARIMSIDRAAVLHEISTIDRIGSALFGKTDAVGPLAHQTHTVDLPASGNSRDIETIIKILS